MIRHSSVSTDGLTVRMRKSNVGLKGDVKYQKISDRGGVNVRVQQGVVYSFTSGRALGFTRSSSLENRDLSSLAPQNIRPFWPFGSERTLDAGERNVETLTVGDQESTLPQE